MQPYSDDSAKDAGVLMPSVGVASCNISDVKQRAVFEKRRLVVSVRCESETAALGLSTTTREEFADGIGFVAATEESKDAHGQPAGRSEVRLREIRHDPRVDPS
jgi:hypothetical protein